MQARVFAPGKLFIIGEYAVLRGGRALVAAVDAGICCSVEERPAGWWLRAADLGVDLPLEAAAAAPRARLLAAAVTAASRHFGVRRPLRVSLAASCSPLGNKRGLGGSASSVVAIAAAIAVEAGEDIESPQMRRRLFRLALGVHREHQQGRGSGADVAASVYGGWVDFTGLAGEPRIAAATVPPELRVLAAWSGVDVDTGAALASSETRLEQRLAPLETVLGRFWGGLGGGDLAAMLAAVSAYGDLLTDLVEAPTRGGAERMAALVRAARDAGAAAKGSGAVGGDCVLALGSRADVVDGVRRSWRRLGVEALPLGIDARGVRMEDARA